MACRRHQRWCACCCWRRWSETCLLLFADPTAVLHHFCVAMNDTVEPYMRAQCGGTAEQRGSGAERGGRHRSRQQQRWPGRSTIDPFGRGCRVVAAWARGDRDVCMVRGVGAGAVRSRVGAEGAGSGGAARGAGRLPPRRYKEHSRKEGGVVVQNRGAGRRCACPQPSVGRWARWPAAGEQATRLVQLPGVAAQRPHRLPGLGAIGELRGGVRLLVCGRRWRERQSEG